ncbi:hypothetical protein JKA74_06920 [Marivirga sp. S37H4]|uniref:Uncharacterized protein n=1 Tax=Marivirga aurantiaca TaxID=2802615 RepID=A0A935C863_9BACT|nr:hypothetical protein [Marivirga aurantiaca]MBK6264762.1 hypothetical protein [Marivirga aurantiaca]
MLCIIAFFVSPKSAFTSSTDSLIVENEESKIILAKLAPIPASVHIKWVGKQDNIRSVLFQKDQGIFIPENISITNDPLTSHIPDFNKRFDFEETTALEEDVIQYNYDDNPIDSISDYVKRAHSLFEKITTESRFVNLINAEVAQDLPMGIKKTIAGYDYVVAIDSIYFTPERSFIVAYMSLPVPGTGINLAFRGIVPFTKEGGISGVAQLMLLEDVPVPLGNKVALNFLAASERTYIEIDCNGFFSLSIDAEVEFSRDLLIPENEDGTLITDRRAKARIQVAGLDSWDSFIASVEMEPFQVTGMEGWGFEVSNAVFDFSEVSNHGAVIFPPDYESVDFLEGNQNMWTGIFIESVSVRLPPQFNNHSQRTAINGSNLIIDKEGFTGTINGVNVLSLGEGDASGWAFSVDNVALEFYKNSLISGDFRGEIVLPIDKKKAGIAYNATITNANFYSITASYNDNIESNLWAANITLDRSSSLNVTIYDGKFMPSANLNGTLSIDTSIGEGSSSKISLPSVKFQNLHISTEAPIVEVGTIEFMGSSNFSNFPLTIVPVGVSNYENGEIGLLINVTVNFAGGEDSGFGAEGQIELVTRQLDTDRLVNFEYVRTNINQLAIDVNAGAFSLNGRVDFFRQDPIYGNGFQGSISATFEPGLEIDAVALFGNTGQFRYWFVDGKVVFPGTGLPVFPGFAIYGFGGGAYHHMKQDGYAASNGFEIGKSLSGIKYIPDASTFMGLRATVVLGTTPSRDAFTGDATFELSFNQNWGLINVGFQGYGEFASAPAELTGSALTDKVSGFASGSEDEEGSNSSGGSTAQITASIFLNYDIPAKTLHGNLSVFVNMANGKVRGSNEGNLAGEAEIYFSPAKWYIHIGHPDRRIGLIFADLFETTSYLMIGTAIPGFPDPPAELQQFFAGKDLGLEEDMGERSSGEGFAFGASMQFGTGDLEFLMFYAKFQVGAGFDIMLKKYDEDVRCAGSSGSFGVNNWYASGQAYAYIQGKVGIKVNLRFYKGNFDIFDVGLAALLQAQLPNPLYMRGMAAGQYNILGGLVKGQCDFEFEIGKRCDMIGGSAIAGVQVISELTPANFSEDVSVFNSPQAVFNLPVNQSFEFSDVDGVVFTYRINLDKLELKYDNQIINGIEEWSPDNMVVAFDAHEILPPEKTIIFNVELSFEERNASGQWVAVTENGVPIKESSSVKFITGEAPPYIPKENIAHMYPIENQFNYYPKETNNGYVILKDGQSYLFNHSSDWEQKLLLTTNEGFSYESDISYAVAEKEVRFNMPTDLRASSIHSLKLIDRPTASIANVDENVSQVTTNAYEGESANVEFTTNDAEGSRDVLQVQDILSYSFRTSEYSTFQEKFNSISKSAVWKWVVMVGVHELGVNLNGNELFDYAEATLDEHALIRIEADLRNTPWYWNKVRPLVYSGLSSSGISLSRDEMPLGTPPKFGTLITMDYYKKLTEDEIAIGVAGSTSTIGTFNYYLPYFMQQDYMDIRTQAASLSLSNSSGYINNILNATFPTLSSGVYPLKIYYKLPGRSTPLRTINFNMDYNEEE